MNIQGKEIEELPWCYLFVHHTKVELISNIISKEFSVFVHKTVIYTKTKHKVVKTLQPTISGLIFIQGKSRLIQNFLDGRFANLHLVRDYCNHKVAVIPDSVMQSFMNIAQFEPSRIRFLANSFEHYSNGHPLVRVTSGPLAGMEGYIVRISRDKRLVTSIGNMTVAIGGINKDSFENVDDYVRLRRSYQNIDKSTDEITFSPLQMEIDKSFFRPDNQIDLMMISRSIESWILKSKANLQNGDLLKASDISLFLLEEIGSYLGTYIETSKSEEFKEITRLSENIDGILSSIVQGEKENTEFKESVEAERQSLLIRFPFLFGHIR